MFKIPSLLLKQLYTFNSLTNCDDGVCFSIKNRLNDAELISVDAVKVNGDQIPLDNVSLDLGDGNWLTPEQIRTGGPIDFPLRKIIEIKLGIDALPTGKHKLEINFESKPFGKLTLKVDDAISEKLGREVKIPRNRADDYSEEIIKKRQQFVEEFSGQKLEHISHYSFDPHITDGNVEHFAGVAQIPIGLAGPITINGEYAKGDFIVPMATTEGTLVASYNRGMKLLNRSGGATVTVSGDVMQRAPVFVFENAREARDFVTWVEEHKAEIAERAEATSSVAKLDYIDSFLSNKFAFLRFNFQTGDAAGQNMVGRATFAACGWILDAYSANKIKHFLFGI
jgi:hydroxymethylglutaryl-CoA reductase (NADPH)